MRLIGELVYMEGMGFLYHSWAESYVEGCIAVDPTLDQVGVDTTHIKLVEGTFWTSVLQMERVVRRIEADVIDYRAQCKQ